MAVEYWLTYAHLQGVLVEGSSERGKLLPRAVDWEGILWKGLPRDTQAHQWVEGNIRLICKRNCTGANKVQVVLKSTSKEDTNLAREIHHHRQFLHPHIARLYEVVVTESLVWLVLEYCPGRIRHTCSLQVEDSWLIHCLF